MKKRFVAFLMIGSIIFAALMPTAYGQNPSGSQSTPAYVVLSAESGQILKENGSTAATNTSLLYRMMICFLVIENIETDMTADIEGQPYTVPDLLKLSLLSDNQAATAALSNLLSPVPGSIIRMMNRRASELGLTNTLFTVADQVEAEYSHTTLQDVAKFIVAAVNNSEFKTLYCTQAAVLSADGTLINNNNKLVMAAGTSKNTGGTLGTYTQDTKNYSSVTYMGNITLADSGSVTSMIFVCDCAEGMDYKLFGQRMLTEIGSHYSRVSIVTTGETLLTLPIGNETLNITAASNTYCMKSADIKNTVELISFTMNEGHDINDIEPPITKDSELGVANILLYDGTTVKVPIVAGNSIYFQNEGFNTFFTSLIANKQIMTLIVILLVIELLLILLKVKRRLGK